MIAVDGDFFNAAARAELDGIEDVDAVAARQFAGWLTADWLGVCWRWGQRLGLVIDFDVEVTLALKVVAQAVVALVEQIFIDAAFFKDGDEVLDAVGFNCGALDFNLDDRPAIGGEVIVN